MAVIFNRIVVSPNIDAAFLRPIVLLISEKLSCLQVDQFGNFLVKDQVFKGASSLRRSENQQEKAEVRTNQAQLNRKSQNQESRGVCLLLLWNCLLEEDVRDHMQCHVSTLNEKDEANDWQISTESSPHWSQVKVCFLDEYRDLFDESTLHRQKRPSYDAFAETTGPAVKEGLTWPAADQVGKCHRKYQ